jgi:uncharacterized protein YkuJ
LKQLDEINEEREPRDNRDEGNFKVEDIDAIAIEVTELIVIP